MLGPWSYQIRDDQSDSCKEEPAKKLKGFRPQLTVIAIAFADAHPSVAKIPSNFNIFLTL
jgi:hypothetical protein